MDAIIVDPLVELLYPHDISLQVADLLLSTCSAVVAVVLAESDRRFRLIDGVAVLRAAQRCGRPTVRARVERFTPKEIRAQIFARVVRTLAERGLLSEIAVAMVLQESLPSPDQTAVPALLGMSERTYRDLTVIRRKVMEIAGPNASVLCENGRKGLATALEAPDIRPIYTKRCGVSGVARRIRNARSAS